MSSDDLYGFVSSDIIKIGNFSIEKPKDISFSKIGLNAKIRLEVIEKSLFINCYAVKGEKEYIVSNHDNIYCDYIIIDNKFYYINLDVSSLNELIEKCSVKIGESINYEEYIYLSKELRKNKIEFEDNIIDRLDELTSSKSNQFLNNLNANLFEYQKSGFNWLKFMVTNNCGCVLADEMGLGKTIQIIALLGYIHEKKHESHFLVVAPVSLLENWRREIEKFYPELKAYIHQGSRRTGFYKKLLEYDVVIISYSNANTDLSMINMIKWDLVILDEAQNIKNPYALRTKTIKNINKNLGIAVTGTPFENHVTDIWSIFDFIMPGYLGTLSNFENTFEDSVVSGYDIDSLIRPLMIRRNTSDVAKDLPERIDIPQPILMTESEAALYENERKVCNLKSISLDMIQSLRMFCTHPLVYNNDIDIKDPIQTST